MKTPLTIQERVDKLLEHGVDKPQKWMSIHAYQDPTWGTNSSHGWAVEYRKLADHHKEETKVLFEIIEELVKRVGKANAAHVVREDGTGT